MIKGPRMSKVNSVKIHRHLQIKSNLHIYDTLLTTDRKTYWLTGWAGRLVLFLSWCRAASGFQIKMHPAQRASKWSNCFSMEASFIHSAGDATGVIDSRATSPPSCPGASAVCPTIWRSSAAKAFCMLSSKSNWDASSERRWLMFRSWQGKGHHILHIYVKINIVIFIYVSIYVVLCIYVCM